MDEKRLEEWKSKRKKRRVMALVSLTAEERQAFDAWAKARFFDVNEAEAADLRETIERWRDETEKNPFR